MTEKRLEEILHSSMPKMHPKEALNRQILAKAEEKRSSRFHGRRLAVAVVACCLLLSSLTVGAATICYILTAERTEIFYTKDYTKIELVEEKAGFDIRFVKEFGNGFAFENMDVRRDKQQAVNGENEPVYTEEIMNVDIWYVREEELVMLSCWENEEAVPVPRNAEVRSIAGVDVVYKENTIEGEALSLAISSAEENEEPEILPMEDISYMTVSWVQDGVNYHLLGMKNWAGKEELLSMTEEIILSE